MSAVEAKAIIKVKGLRKAGGNVSALRDYRVQEVYKSFISSQISERTAYEYDKRVREFFRLVLDKDVEHVTYEELRNIKKSDIKNDYVAMLMAKGNSGNTIDTKVRSVKSFYNELQSNDLKVNPMIFKMKFDIDVKHHNALSSDELQQLFEFMKGEKNLGIEKYLLAKTLFTTGNRRSATFGMTWNDNFIIRKDIDTHRDIHIIRVKDKGSKWIEKPISDEYYEELQQLNKGQKYVFEFSDRTMERALERFSKELGKKITMHGLKATAITLGYKMTRDINLCKQLGGHSSIVTTEIYLREEQSLVNQLSYNMSRTIDESILDEMDKYDFIEFLNQNEDIKTMMLLRLGK
jgi:integrase